MTRNYPSRRRNRNPVARALRLVRPKVKPSDRLYRRRGRHLPYLPSDPAAVVFLALSLLLFLALSLLCARKALAAEPTPAVFEELDLYNGAAARCTQLLLDQPPSLAPVIRGQARDCREAILLGNELVRRGFSYMVGDPSFLDIGTPGVTP